MEPITATLTTAKEISEATKITIQKVNDISKGMRSVAESEGKDLIRCEEKEPLLSKDIFVDKPETTYFESGLPSDTIEFVDKLPPEDFPKELQNLQVTFVDRLPTNESSAIRTELPIEQPKPLGTNSAIDSAEQNSLNSIDATESATEKKAEGLTYAEKQNIKDKTGWSDKIVNAIRTKDESEVYINAELVEGEVNGKPTLLQPSIDGKACNESKWPDWNNKDLAEEGYPPRDQNGRPYELHHIGQNPDSPLAELTYEQHHCDGNFKVLHTFDESSIDRIQFNKERKDYWTERSKTL